MPPQQLQPHRKRARSAPRSRAPLNPRARRAASLLAGAALILSALVSGISLAAAPAAKAATCGTTNAALNKTATASSTENAGTPASAAVDGNTGTRWSSAFSDPQWLEVDLGSSQGICGVTLNWETAYGKSFQIQTSTDNANWTSIFSTTTGTGGIQNLTGLTGTGRYVRMNGTVRGTQYGYSLWELQVFTTGSGGGGNTVTVTNPGAQSWTAGTPASLQIQATDSASGQTLTYSATGLPAGLSVNASTGLISGTPTTATSGSITATVTDTTAAS